VEVIQNVHRAVGRVERESQARFFHQAKSLDPFPDIQVGD